MSSENIKQGNPLAEEKIGRLIARFAVPAIISMLVSSLYNIVDQIFIGQGVGLLGMRRPILLFRYLLYVQLRHFCWESEVHRIITWKQGREEMTVQQRSQAMDLLCW